MPRLVPPREFGTSAEVILDPDYNTVEEPPRLRTAVERGAREEPYFPLSGGFPTGVFAVSTASFIDRALLRKRWPALQKSGGRDGGLRNEE